jgi:hypothetical protein
MGIFNIPLVYKLKLNTHWVGDLLWVIAITNNY